MKLTVAPTIKNDITYIPLRYVAESLDIRVDFDKALNKIIMNESLEYKNQKIYIGDPTNEIITSIGDPSFTMADEVYKYLFYTDDYRNLLILLTKNNIVTGFTISAETMKFRGLTYNSKVEHVENDINFAVDGLDGEKLVALGYNTQSMGTFTAAALLANERIIFELTNGFRAHHGIPSLNYSSQLSNIARKHSNDMASKNYFSHDGLDGTSMSDRISQGGINWMSCGENIAAGNKTGFDTFTQWLHSSGHRDNMLKQKGDLGVGSAYNANSSYGYYHTQNFARTY